MDNKEIFNLVEICVVDSINPINSNNMNENTKTDTIMHKVIDLALLHTSASFVVPAVTIHAIINGVTKFQNKFIPLKLRPFFPTVIGLISIPFIITPINIMTNTIINHTIRKYYDKTSNN